jgi:hypothetical protein
MQRRKFSREFKVEAVKLVREGGRWRKRAATWGPEEGEVDGCHIALHPFENTRSNAYRKSWDMPRLSSGWGACRQAASRVGDGQIMDRPHRQLSTRDHPSRAGCKSCIREWQPSRLLDRDGNFF